MDNILQEGQLAEKKRLTSNQYIAVRAVPKLHRYGVCGHADFS